MKKTINVFAVGMVAVLCCSMGKADNIIYSNNFALGTGVNISNTLPTVANTYAGGISSAHWQDIDGVNNTHGPLLDNGIDSCGQVDYWALPFTPTNGFIYLLTVNLTFTNNPGVAAEIGFSQNYTTNYTLDARFNGNANGYNWMAITESSGNVQYFAGAKTTTTIFSGNNVFPANKQSTNTFQILLNTESSPWSVAGFVNGAQVGSVFTYGANPTGLSSVGMSQNGVPTLPTAIQYNSFVLTTTEQPFITTQPVASKIVGGGTIYTNSVIVIVDTNAGSLSYQWYANNAPLVNGVNNVSGANSNVLTINPISSINQFSNYYVVVSNNFGSATSSLASVTVLTNIVPTTTGGAITLFTGSAGLEGSSPSFSASGIGAPPITFQWATNGVAIAGATNSSIAFTNLQAGSPSTYACTLSNSFGATNVTWTASYLSAPTAAYPQAVLGDIPFNLWRLNESDDGNGNLGAVSHDYQTGDNGVYTNVILGQTGYNSLETSETSLAVTATGNQPSVVKLIANSDLAATMTNGVNAQFTVEAWANCISGNGASGGAPVISQGAISNQSSFFLGVDTNTTKHYLFYVRNAAGTVFSADATNTARANDAAWHYLVGVCDQAHSNISLYIDGQLSATASITPNTGLFESGRPVAIGAGIRPASTDYDVPFTGNIADVAIYSHALSLGQIIAHYTAVNSNTVAVTFNPPLPPTNVVYQLNKPLTISASASGSASLGYYWSNVATASVISPGTSASSTVNATLTIPSASASLNGQQLELVVTNSVSSTNAFVTLTTPPAPVTLPSSSPVLYSNLFNGGVWSITGLPLSAENILVGGTNTVWVDVLGTNNTGGGMLANGTPATAQADSWLLPFTPHSGYIYTLSGSLAFTGNPGNWVGLGFTQIIPTNATNGDARFADSPNNAYDWIILTESTGNVQYFAGANGNGTVVSVNSYFTAGVGAHNAQVVLDTTGAQWKYYSVVDGKISATNAYGSGVPSGALTNNPPIGAVGFEQNALTAGAQGSIQWSNIVLTQVAPGGVPPYLLDPQPPTNVTLTSGTITIPATAYGSAPFGYYWSNNAAVLASGSTASMAPFAANLSVPGSSLSAGPLQLVVTNAFGTNITVITLASSINPNPGPILYSVAGNQLTLSWPTNLGWTLQAQTNDLPAGISTNWVNVANSSATNQVIVPISPTNGSAFYRLILP